MQSIAFSRQGSWDNQTMWIFHGQFFRSFAVFCGLVSELANVWDGQVELAGSVVGGGSEVDEVLKSPSHSLC